VRDLASREGRQCAVGDRVRGLQAEGQTAIDLFLVPAARQASFGLLRPASLPVNSLGISAVGISHHRAPIIVEKRLSQVVVLRSMRASHGSKRLVVDGAIVRLDSTGVPTRTLSLACGSQEFAARQPRRLGLRGSGCRADAPINRGVGAHMLPTLATNMRDRPCTIVMCI
jgi:hypothetical protein